MALPSSPPLLPEIDPLSSPSLPALVCPPSTLPLRAVSRKRPLCDHDGISSDPLFSDDPSDAGVQSQNEPPRRKRMIKGPWWSLVRRSEREREEGIWKDSFRNVDSGVWMGSDLGSDSVDDGAPLDRSEELCAQVDVPSSDLPAIDSSPTEGRAAEIVQSCIEAGKEMVDLSDLGLERIDGAILKPLHQLIRQSHVHLTHPPSEDEFMPLTPAIQLFLARNRLTSLPAELFSLDNLTVLSLRSNELVRLPPAIGRLERLEELNVGGNEIRCLPWEMLPLFGCGKQITVRPNPLYEAANISGPSSLDETEGHTRNEWQYRVPNDAPSEDETPLDDRGELELRLKSGRTRRREHLKTAHPGTLVPSEEVICLASSAVQYFGVDGLPIRQLAPVDPKTEQNRFEAAIHVQANKPPPLLPDSTPSLFELALRSVQREYHLDLPVWQLYEFPASLRIALQKAGEGIEMGNETCSSCGRHYVIARAEWVEYWFIGLDSQVLSQELVLPFSRRTCSWACARPTEAGDFRIGKYIQHS